MKKKNDVESCGAMRFIIYILKKLGVRVMKSRRIVLSSHVAGVGETKMLMQNYS
jgi:hypothetical protein